MIEKIETNPNFRNRCVASLIIETATRLNYGSPQQFQTGPALRSDNSVVNKHVEMLKEDKMVQIIYKELTNYIKTKHNKHE